jgi:late competence protein required for DNA uptake (superfamily II DNA/RNA helicase)
MFDYEKEIYDALQQTKYVWIKKATGLGITEFCLRWIAWMCLRDDKLKGSQVCIITGSRVDLAITLIKRLKGLSPDIVFDAQRGLPSLYSTKLQSSW